MKWVLLSIVYMCIVNTRSLAMWKMWFGLGCHAATMAIAICHPHSTPYTLNHTHTHTQFASIIMSWLKVMFLLFDWVWQFRRQKCSYLTRNILTNFVYSYDSAFELFSPISDFLKIATTVSNYNKFTLFSTTNNTQSNWMAYATTDDMLFLFLFLFVSTSVFMMKNETRSIKTLRAMQRHCKW